jgi:hypothetical protein
MNNLYSTQNFLLTKKDKDFMNNSNVSFFNNKNKDMNNEIANKDETCMNEKNIINTNTLTDDHRMCLTTF